MTESWGTVIAAVLTAITGIVVAWLSSRKPVSIADQMKPFAEALAGLDSSSDADEINKLKAMRRALVTEQFKQTIANTGISRVLYVATVAWAVPVFAGAVLWIWFLATAPLETDAAAGRLSHETVFELGKSPAMFAFGGLIVLLVLFFVTYGVRTWKGRP